jgi:hypothetical protein
VPLGGGRIRRDGVMLVLRLGRRGGSVSISWMVRLSGLWVDEWGEKSDGGYNMTGVGKHVF